jgi:hypothetical protein
MDIHIPKAGVLAVVSKDIFIQEKPFNSTELFNIVQVKKHFFLMQIPLIYLKQPYTLGAPHLMIA